MSKAKPADLKIFIDKYQPAKFKQLKNGIEVRSVHDVEIASNKARQLINDLSLRLMVVRDANAASRGAFEVTEVAS
jgi:hypothetical protein